MVTRLAEFYRHGGDELLGRLYEESANVRIAYQRAVEMNGLKDPITSMTLLYYSDAWVIEEELLS